MSLYLGNAYFSSHDLILFNICNSFFNKISVYKYFIEKAVANVKEDEIVAGEICISQVKGHVMTFQFSEGCYRLYDAENGFYFYPSAKEFYEHTRNLLLGKHAEFGSKGYNLLVQIKIYAIKKEVSRNSE